MKTYFYHARLDFITEEVCGLVEGSNPEEAFDKLCAQLHHSNDGSYSYMIIAFNNVK